MRVMAFVDGENLTSRFEAMLKDENRKPRTTHDPYVITGTLSHIPGRLVWSNATVHKISQLPFELVRVQYYTTFAGGNDELEKFTQQVAGLQALKFVDGGQWQAQWAIPLVPRVFKKESRGTRTKSVDINLCVDVLEYVRQNSLDAVYLVTGDVDYLPLIEAVMRSGKRMYLAALSSGLSPRLRYGMDGFIPLDETYFMP